jgi:predicted RNase H-like HicB family nuclease
MKTTALIEKGKDSTFSIFTPDINHVIIGEGNNVHDAKADFENSVKEMLASYTETGRKVPKELQDIEFEFKYDVASVFDEYDFINVSKFAAYSGMNASLMRQYKTKKDIYVSEAQIKKIEDGFHRAAKSFAAIRLL